MNAHKRCRPLGIVLAVAVVLLCLTGGSFGMDCLELCKQGREQISKSRYKDALTTFSEAIRLSPKDVYARMGLALAYQGLNNYEKVIESCDEGIRLHPQKSIFYALRADTLAAQNKIDDALKSYTTALSYDHSSSNLYLDRAKIYLSKKMFTEAFNDFDDALKLDEQDVWARVNRGRVAYERGDTDEALKDFAIAAQLEPKFAGHYYWQAVISFERRDFEAVFKLTEKALFHDPKFSPAFALRGLAFHYREDDDKAIADFRDAIDNNKADPTLLLWRGRVYYDKKKYEKAIDDFQEVLRLTRDLPLSESRIAAYRERAKAYEKLEKPERELAKADLKAADELESKQPRKADADRPLLIERLRAKLPGLFDSRLNDLTAADQKHPAPDQIMLVEAKSVAEKLRPPAQDVHGLVEKVAVASLFPEPCTAAQKTLQQAKECFDRKEYELAALGYRSTSSQCEKLLDNYEDRLGHSPEIWLKWAREKADRVQDPKTVWAFWLTVADVERLFGNREEQQRALKKALDKAGNVSFSNPQETVVGLTALTRTLLGQGDKETARETLREAASICENLNQPIPAAYYNAMCAGLFARLGDTAGWQKHFEIALKRSTASHRDDVKNHADLTTARAYAFADDPQKAFGLAQDFERQRCPNISRPNVASFMAITYAQIAFAEARLHSKDHNRTSATEPPPSRRMPRKLGWDKRS